MKALGKKPFYLCRGELIGEVKFLVFEDIAGYFILGKYFIDRLVKEIFPEGNLFLTSGLQVGSSRVHLLGNLSPMEKRTVK